MRNVGAAKDQVEKLIKLARTAGSAKADKRDEAEIRLMEAKAELFDLLES